MSWPPHLNSPPPPSPPPPLAPLLLQWGGVTPSPLSLPPSSTWFLDATGGRWGGREGAAPVRSFTIKQFGLSLCLRISGSPRNIFKPYYFLIFWKQYFSVSSYVGVSQGGIWTCRIRIWGQKCWETGSRGENIGKTKILKFLNFTKISIFCLKKIKF